MNDSFVMIAPLPKTLPMLRMRVTANRDDPPTLSTDTLNHIKKLVGLTVLNYCNKHKMSSLLALSCLHPDVQTFSNYIH